MIRLKEVEGEIDPLAVILDMGEGKKQKQIWFENPSVDDSNAIKEELKSFAEAINNNTVPAVTIEDGFAALQVAHQVADKLKMLPAIA